jgi:ParB family transcriptional regulator, chromosome partitioning protein
MKRITAKKQAVAELQAWAIAETLLPEYSSEQYNDLEEFLRNGGELAPIIITKNNIIIDGYNRWRLARKIGLENIECDVYSYDDESEMEMHAIVLNSKRRHLNKLQVARAAVRLINLETVATDDNENNEVQSENLEQEKEVVELAIDEAIETDSTTETASPVETDCPIEVTDQGEISEVAVNSVAKKLGVAKSTVKQVNKVDHSNDKVLITAMEDKVITIKQAAKIAGLAKDKRKGAIEALDMENIKRNSISAILSRHCDSFTKRLKSNKKKIAEAGLSEDDKDSLKEQMHKVILESQSIIEQLSASTTD